MPDFLTNLSQRFLGTAPLVQPRLPSFFASGRREAGPLQSHAELSFPIRTESERGSAEGIIGVADARHPSGNVSSGSRVNGALHPVPFAIESSVQRNQEKGAGPNVQVNRSPQMSNAEGREVGSGNKSSRTNQSRSTGHSSLLPPLEASSTEVRSGGEVHPPDGIPTVMERGDGSRERESSFTSRKTQIESTTRESEREEEANRKPSEENPSRHLPLRLVPLVPNDSSENRSQSIEIEGREDSVRGTTSMKVEENPFGSISEHRVAESERGGIDNAARHRTSFQSLLPASSGEEVRKGKRMEREEERNTIDAEKLLLPDHASRKEFGGVTSLPLIARDNPEAGNSSSRTINVTIGRIEVRGTPNQKTERRQPRPPGEKSSPPSPTMSLDDYLKRYNRRGE